MPENSSCSSAGSCTKSSCEGCPSHNGGPQSFLVEQNKFSNIKHVIGVVSGKGGVGKSFVTSSLAVNMAKKGYKVGILDADITGPSIPKMFGAHDQILGDENGLMHPYETKEGIKLISVNLLMDNEEDPVIWRGPVIAGVVKQFWNETAWGDIDYLFVDMPPGTGDVPLSMLIITHNTRILEHLDVDRVHVMVKGHIVREDDASLIPWIDKNGFETFEREAAEQRAQAEAAAAEQQA